MADYDLLKVVELRALLKTRQLKATGIRGVMIRTLKDHDFAEQERRLRAAPFRFLDLPPELRNMIYKMITRHPRAYGRIVNPFISARRARHKAQQGNREEITQPNLFCASAMIRDESIGLFYQLRNFEVDLAMELHALKFLQSWLKGIGKEAYQTIRSLTLNIGRKNLLSGRLCYIVTYLLENLSKEATITCQAEGSAPARKLWGLGLWCIKNYGSGFSLCSTADGQPYQKCVLEIGPGRPPVKAVDTFTFHELYDLNN